MKILIIKMLLFLSLGLTELQAQTLFVKEASGTKTEYLLNKVKMLKFSTGSITINKTDGNFEVYDLSGLRYLSFKEVNTRIDKIDSESKVIEINIYPNPVKDLLNINIQFSKSENQFGAIEIFTIEGRKVFEQKIYYQINDYQINAATFPKGIYLCKINMPTNIETIKFLKL